MTVESFSFKREKFILIASLFTLIARLRFF